MTWFDIAIGVFAGQLGLAFLQAFLSMLIR